MHADELPAWIENWQTADRYRKYLKAAGWDRERALALYSWNGRLAADFLHDLGHFEVGLRNAYDRALLGQKNLEGADWLTDAGASTLFPSTVDAGGHRTRKDWNQTPRRKIREAARRGRLIAGAPRGKTIAEFDFGFWTYLTDQRHEKQLWVPLLHRVFPPGTSRAALHDSFSELRFLRNRVAHHESVFDQDPEGRRRQIIGAANQLSTELGAYIAESSFLPGLLSRRV